jgi:hypothetical protein
MKRRELILALGGAAEWPLAARAHQARRPRRVAALWPFNETDPDGQTLIAPFREGLRDLGWADGTDRKPLGRRKHRAYPGLCLRTRGALAGRDFRIFQCATGTAFA